MGLQSGSVVGGVIGVKHPRYRLFGDIVNTAARMETRSDPGRLHVAEAAAAILTETGMFQLTDRGSMAVKGKGVMHTYFVDGLAADVVEAGELESALVRIARPSFAVGTSVLEASEIESLVTISEASSSSENNDEEASKSALLEEASMAALLLQQQSAMKHRRRWRQIGINVMAVGPDGYCSPCHPTHFVPWVLDLNDTL